MKRPQVKGSRSKPVPRRAAQQFTRDKKSFPITISLNRAMLDDLDRVADELGASRSLAVREILEYYIAHHREGS